MKRILELHIQWLKYRLAKATKREKKALEANLTRKYLRAISRRVKLQEKLKDEQALYDLQYTDKYCVHISVKRQK